LPEVFAVEFGFEKAHFCWLADWVLNNYLGYYMNFLYLVCCSYMYSLQDFSLGVVDGSVYFLYFEVLLELAVCFEVLPE